MSNLSSTRVFEYNRFMQQVKEVDVLPSCGGKAHVLAVSWQRHYSDCSLQVYNLSKITTEMFIRTKMTGRDNGN